MGVHNFCARWLSLAGIRRHTRALGNQPIHRIPPISLSLSLSFCCALGQGPRAARPSRLHHCYTILIERLGCIRKQKLRHAKAQVGRALAFQRLSLSLPSFLQAKVRENGPAPRRPFPSFVYEKKGFGAPQGLSPLRSWERVSGRDPNQPCRKTRIPASSTRPLRLAAANPQ